jgi:ElaB/YqjD/DUF883 family membrane-anchored ribosome-binding protein
MAEEHQVFRAGGRDITYFRGKVDDYLDMTTVVLGGTGTGKSTIIKDIIYLCKDYVPLYLVLCNQTSAVMYERLGIPKEAIKQDLGPDVWKSVYERQMVVTHLYKVARDPDVLEKLCRRVCRSISDDIAKIKNYAKNLMEERGNLSEDAKDALKDKVNSRIVDLCHTTIEKERDRISLIRNQLSDDEQTAFLNYKLNPKFMIVVDDRTELIKKWIKDCEKIKDGNPIDGIFFAGRHFHISLVIAAHAEIAIPLKFRTNARVIFYTSGPVLLTATKRGNFAGTDEDKLVAKTLATDVFDDKKSGEKKHRKVCYMQNEPSDTKWRYTVAKQHGPFTVGCDAMRELSRRLPERSAKYLETSLAKRASGRSLKKDSSGSVPKLRKGARKY